MQGELSRRRSDAGESYIRKVDLLLAALAELPLLQDRMRVLALAHQTADDMTGRAGTRLPLGDDQKPAGAPTTATATAEFAIPRDDTRLLQALATCTDLVLENLRAHGELEQRVRDRTAELQRAHDAIHKLAITDELTGLCNRRGFHLLAEQALKHAARRKKPCVLLFMDLDGLKQVNDSHGHGAGDALLSAAADVLRATFRQSDVVGRTGGDEFCVLALDSADGGAVRNRLLDHIDRFNREERASFALSASLGTVEVAPEGAPPLGELLAHADRAMYRDKRQRTGTRTSAPPDRDTAR